MATITCLKELEEKGILQKLDIVEFTVNKEIIEYTVCHSFLSTNKVLNSTIFKILGLNPYKIAEKRYKYKITQGCWPNSNFGDFPALTRLVKELYKIIEGKEMIYTKFTRFEIMEI